MVWVLEGRDPGAREGAPTAEGIARSLIAQALEALNAGEQCTAIDDSYGIAAMAVYTGTRPECIRIGYAVDDRPELVKLMEDYGAREASVHQIHWVYDIPIKQE